MLWKKIVNIQYRPEIDGLRAIAVAAVVLYHAEFMFHGTRVLTGGFIGVDIFFVISGYLIASIIIREINEGKFSFLNFYERRARRILPALFTVMIASIPLAWMFMLPKAMKEYSGSILSALAFNSNIWFWKADSYWAEPSALKPFLHTWSLSVEEQFYFLFPIMLLVLWKLARNHIISSLVAMFFLSLLMAHLGSAKYTTATFFLLPTRGWELLAGIILAKLEFDGGRVNRPFLDATMPIVGLLLIFSALMFFNDKTRHPSVITLIPILGVMLLIWYSKKDGFVTSVLASKPFVSIGLISYGLYLWHFPIFAFSKIIKPAYSQFDKIGWIVISLLLSIGTYFLIETPARDKNQFKTKGCISILLMVFFSIALIQIYFFQTHGAEFRFNSFSKFVDMNYWSDTKDNKKEFFTQTACWLGESTIDPDDPFKTCKLHEKLSPANRIMVIGDSNVAALIPGLIKNFGRNTIVERVLDGCLPSTKFTSSFCRAGITAALKEVKKINPDLIIIGGYYTKREDLLELKTLFDYELKLYRNKTIIVGPLPRWGEDLPARLLKLYNKNWYKFKVPRELAPSPETFTLDRSLSELSRQWGIKYLSPVKTFCSETKCLVKVGPNADEITSFDIVHLTHSASIFLVDENSDLIKSFLRRPNPLDN